MWVKISNSFVLVETTVAVDYKIDDEELVGDAVVRAVSAVQGLDPCSIEPLAGVIDPEALDTLFSDRHDGTPRSGGHLSFVYGGCRVTVDNGEYLTVETLERLRAGGRAGSGSGVCD